MDRRTPRYEGDVELYGSMIDVTTQEANVDVGIAKVISVLATSHPANPVNVGSDSVNNASGGDHRRGGGLNEADSRRCADRCCRREGGGLRRW